MEGGVRCLVVDPSDERNVTYAFVRREYARPLSEVHGTLLQRLRYLPYSMHCPVHNMSW